MSEGKVLVGEGGFDLQRSYAAVRARTTVVFPHARALLDDQATETNVRTIERPLVLYMTTHGFFGEARSDRDNPLFRSELMSEGVAGLRRAFAMAGARTMVMSLWEVSGVTTKKTMEAYYRKLAEGMGRGEAGGAARDAAKRGARPSQGLGGVHRLRGCDTPMVFPAGQEPREVAEEEPPQTGGGGGCATRHSGRDKPTGSMLIGLLGLTVLRRRGR